MTFDRLEIKAAISVDDAGALTGIAWPFNAGPDQVGDVITPGAFNVVDDLPMLLGHDPEQPIGLWDSVKETAEGLQVKGQLFVDQDRRARSVRSMVKSGLISGLSIGFKTKSSTPRPGKGRVISALDLKEISVVRNPAHPRSRIHSVKTASAAIAIAEAINRAAMALRKD